MSNCPEESVHVPQSSRNGMICLSVVSGWSVGWHNLLTEIDIHTKGRRRFNIFHKPELNHSGMRCIQMYWYVCMNVCVFYLLIFLILSASNQATNRKQTSFVTKITIFLQISDLDLIEIGSGTRNELSNQSFRSLSSLLSVNHQG